MATAAVVESIEEAIAFWPFLFFCFFVRKLDLGGELYNRVVYIYIITKNMNLFKTILYLTDKFKSKSNLR